jgi:hypothetical protein
MKYHDGQTVKVGDRVQLWSGCHGVVICSIDDNEYSDGYAREQWVYLKSGVLIQTEKAGLIHYIEADEDLQLIQRK